MRQSLADQPEQYEALSQEESIPTLECWVEQHFPGLIENFGLSFFHELINDAKVGEQILRMKWWLWDFSRAGRELVLSDRPCILTHGLHHPLAVIALPISPTKAFMASQDAQIASLIRRQKPKHLAMRLNESAVSQARVRVYARNASRGRFIRNRLSSRMIV